MIMMIIMNTYIQVVDKNKKMMMTGKNTKRGKSVMAQIK